MPPPRIRMIPLGIADLVVAAGGKLIKPAQDTFWGGCFGYFSDPGGPDAKADGGL